MSRTLSQHKMLSILFIEGIDLTHAEVWKIVLTMCVTSHKWAMLFMLIIFINRFGTFISGTICVLNSLKAQMILQVHHNPPQHHHTSSSPNNTTISSHTQDSANNSSNHNMLNTGHMAVLVGLALCLHLCLTLSVSYLYYLMTLVLDAVGCCQMMQFWHFSTCSVGFETIRNFHWLQTIIEISKLLYNIELVHSILARSIMLSTPLKAVACSDNTVNLFCGWFPLALILAFHWILSYHGAWWSYCYHWRIQQAE